MAVTDTEIEWTEDNVKERLEALYKKDTIWPAVLAARAALRVFPLVGVGKQFAFWVKNEHVTVKPPLEGLKYDPQQSDSSSVVLDNRVYYLMASFYASRLVLQQASIPYEQRERLKLASATAAVASAFSSASEAAYAASGTTQKEYDVAAYVVDVITQAAAAARSTVTIPSKFASKVSSESARETAEQIATKAMFAVRCVKDVVVNVLALFESDSIFSTNPKTAESAASEVVLAFLHDLKAAESASSTLIVINSPLWSDTCPREIRNIKTNNFRPAVETLINEISGTSPDSAKALTQMLYIYDKYLSGVTNDDENGESNETLYEALSKVSAEDVNSDRDTLNRGALVNGLASILCDKEHTHPLTIGLMGNWGSGKSQILALLKKELKDRGCTQQFLFGEFNAWAYEHAKSSQAAMAHEVISALTSHDKFQTVDMKSGLGTRLKQSASNLFRQFGWIVSGRFRIIYGFAVTKHLNKVLLSIGWLSLFVIASAWLARQGISQNQIPDFSKPLTSGALIAIIASLWQLPKQLRYIISQPMTKEFLTYIKLPNYAPHIGEIAEMQKDIRLIAKIRLGFEDEACHDYLSKFFKPRRLLFVVDDLDRCSPNGIVKTFEAIRLVLHIPHVTVVVAVDQRIALAALALHYKGIEPYHTLQDARAIARDYLAKVIQLPIVVSDGDNESLTEFLSEIWLKKGDNKRDWLAHLIEDDAYQTLAGHEKVKTPSSKPDRQDVNSDTEDEGLSEYELAKLILETEPKSEPTEPEVLKGLSDHQKAALYYWATNFGLTNARQLKRLDNSYNLVRLVTDEEDKLALIRTSKGVNKQHVKFSYGYLVTLMTLEFINGIEVTTLRENASRFLRKGEIGKLACMANKQHKATLIAARVVIQHAAKQLNPQTESQLHLDKLLSYVENFVLPAIDGFDVDTETASSS